MSLKKPAVILACAAIAIVLLVSMGSLGPEPIESQSSFAQPETFTIKPEVTKFTEVSAVLEPSSTQLEPTASVMDVGLDKSSLFLNPAYAISSTQTSLSYTSYPTNGNYGNGDVYSVCGNDVYMASNNMKLVHIDTTTNVLTTWDISDVGSPNKTACDNSGNVYFGTSGKIMGKLDTQTNTLDWYDFDGTVVGATNQVITGPNNEIYFNASGAIGKLNFNTGEFVVYDFTHPNYNYWCDNPGVFDSSGNLYTTSGGSAPLICKLDFSSNTNTYWNLQTENTNVSIGYVDVDQNNNIFTTYGSHGKIAKIVQSSNLVTLWQVPNSNYAGNIKVDASGNVFLKATGGLWRLVTDTDTFTQWTTNQFTANFLYMDENILWHGNSGSIWKLT